MLLNYLQPAKLQIKKIVIEDVFPAPDSVTLEHLKELSSRRRLIEEAINQSSSITEAMARKMSGDLTSHCLRERAEEILPAESVERPLEATPSMSTFMNRICLAEAQAVTIKKAEDKGNTGHLSKLHYVFTDLPGEATAILYSNTTGYKDISSCFLEFLSSCKAFRELRSLKYLAEGLKKADQVGVAVGILRDALSNVKKKVPGQESWRSIIREEIGDASDMLQKFEYENEFVWHEKIPGGDKLPLPQGAYVQGTNGRTGIIAVHAAWCI